MNKVDLIEIHIILAKPMNAERAEAIGKRIAAAVERDGYRFITAGRTVARAHRAAIANVYVSDVRGEEHA